MLDHLHFDDFRIQPTATQIVRYKKISYLSVCKSILLIRVLIVKFRHSVLRVVQ